MDSVEFVKAYRRICGANACTKCPLWVDEHYACMMDAKVTDKAQLDESKVVSAVEQWSNEHPIITHATKFLAQYPDAPISETVGLPAVAPCDISKEYEAKRQKCGAWDNCSACRKEFWNSEVE